MTGARKLTLDFVLGYFKYLSKWNKSASLMSIINSFDHYYKNPTDDNMTELEIVADFEWDDTVKNFSNGDDILSLNDMYNILITENRDKKINKILDEN